MRYVLWNILVTRAVGKKLITNRYLRICNVTRNDLFDIIKDELAGHDQVLQRLLHHYSLQHGPANLAGEADAWEMWIPVCV